MPSRYNTCKCIVPGCKPSKSVSFHYFPKDYVVFRKWVEFASLNENDVLNSTRMCESHFSKECFRPRTKKNRLWVGAVPTIYPGESSSRTKVSPDVCRTDDNNQHSPNQEVPDPCMNSTFVTEDSEPKHDAETMDVIGSKEAEVKEVKESTEALRDIKESKEAVRDVKDSTKAVRDVKDSTKAVRDVKDSTKAVRDVKDSTKAVRDAKESTKAVRDAKESTKAVRDAKESTKAVRDAKESTKAVRDAKESKEAVRDAKESKEAVRDAKESKEAVRDAKESKEAVRDTKESKEAVRNIKESKVAVRNIKESKEAVRDAKESKEAVRDVKESKKAVRDVKESKKAVRDVKESKKPVRDAKESKKAVRDAKESKEAVRNIKESKEAVRDAKESDEALRDIRESNKAVGNLQESKEAVRDVLESKDVSRSIVRDGRNLESKEFESKEANVNMNEPQGTVRGVKEPVEVKGAATELKRQTSSSGGRGRDRDRSESDSLLQHLQCSYCMLQCKSHCSYFIHMAKFHPSRLDDTPVGRLGNAIFYQRTARLFHCNVCFHTVREFPRLYDHLLTRHCLSDKGQGGGGEEGEEGCEEGDGDGDGERCSIRDGGPLKNCRLLPRESMAVDEENGGPKKEKEECIKGEEEMEVGEDHDESSQLASRPLKRKRGSTASSEKDEQDEEEEELQTANSNKKSDKHKKEEEAFLSKYIQRQGGRFNCRLCGWRTKMKGRAIYHVSYKHDVPKPYSCKECSKVFILESSMLNHIYHNHRQGMYHCLFCPFSSDVVWGIKRHGNRCNARSEEGEEEEVSDGDE
uniref:THAP-type domain-containing protein n=1 Tax=Esox lucius TaxID=8010 RepID=A0AAY5KYN2_ESOLU